MLSHGVEFAKYGVQTTFYLSFEDITDAEAPFTGTAPLAADIWLSKDGGAPANATNAMTAIGNGVYSWVATATEMQATRLAVSVYDATASAIFKPAYLVINTKLQLGQLDIDATQIGGNTAAIVLQAVGSASGVSSTGGATGAGALFTGGATSGAGMICQGAAGNSNGIRAVGVGNANALDLTGAGTGAGLAATGGATGNGITLRGGATSGAGADIAGAAGNSNGVTIAGVGSGAGVISTGGATGHGMNIVGGATSGTGLRAVATATNDYNNLFAVTEGTEPSGAIGNNATFGAILQYVKRRWFNRNTQTSTTQTTYKDDSSTALQTRTAADDGTTQSLAKSA